MKFSKTFPDYESIELQVRRAHSARAAFLAELLAAGIATTVEGVRKVAASVAAGIQAQRNLRGMEANVFVKRATPR